MLLALMLVVAAALGPGCARRHAPDLREDEPARRTNRPAECLFGKQAKELGSKWFADLGPPFGVMYCIKCECIAVQKKRRVVAKVHCRNIKNECPEPSCDTPVLLPGRCCKTCPGDLNSPDIVQEDSPMVITAEEEEHNMRYFASFLTGRSPLCVRRDDMSGIPVAPGVATARFTFRRRHLYWSLILSPSITSQPRALAFLDKVGRVLLEQSLKKIPGIHTIYEEKTDKLCGVWRRVPRQYKSLLRDGDLHVALLWGNDGNSSIDSALSGRIDRYPALTSEMFTTLLEPEHPPPSFGQGACRDYGAMDHEDGWWGGTAVVTAAAGVTPSIYLALVFNGVFPKATATSHLVKVILTLPEKNQTIVDEVQRITKPDYHLNVLEVTTPVSAAELRSLARGRLLLTIEAVGAPDRRIVGSVRQKAACEMFHAPLAAERIPASASPEGLALLYIDKEGSLVYDIQIDNLGSTDPKITLVEEQGKRHSQVEILDTRIGVLARPSARIFQPLYEDQLAVHIGGDTGPPMLRGRLTSKLLPDAAGAGPALLRRTSQIRIPMTMAGLAWVSVDSLCGVYYETVVIGNNLRSRSSWWLETHLVGEESARELGAEEGWILEPTNTELMALQRGAVYLELRSNDNVTVLMRTRVPQIVVPESCLPSIPGAENNELTPKTGSNDDQSDNAIYRLNQGYCSSGEQLYKTGDIWTDTKTCSKCVCVLGTSRCEPVQCPKINCLTPPLMPQGQCCPICTNSTTALWSEEGSCILAGQHYPPGSSWHPYLVPGGYDTCVTCTCNFDTRQIHCPRVRCPPLHCSEKEAYRVDKRACCRVCPEPRAKKADEETLKDQAIPKTAEEILAEGGCKFPDGPLPNGKEVHPSIHSHGEQRCVTCRCKDGEVTCVRKRCGRAACKARRRADACCACARHRPRRQHHPPPS